MSQGLNPTKLQTDSTGFTLESVIHIGYELAITTTINLGGAFFRPSTRWILPNLVISFIASQEEDRGQLGRASE